MPKIAVLGWGSLVWDPRDLDVQLPWYEDGPALPIEFARISCDGRLTLVIYPDAVPVPVLWAVMNSPGLTEARQNLAQREKAHTDKPIGWVSCGETPQVNSDHAFSTEIRGWAAQKGMDSVIWTALPGNFEEKTHRKFTMDNAVAYLKGLQGERRRSAEEYVRRTHPQVRTQGRNVFENMLGWLPVRTTALSTPGCQ